MELEKELTDLTNRKYNIEKHLLEEIEELFEFGGSHEYLEAISFLFTAYTESDYAKDNQKEVAKYSFSMTRLMMFLSQLEIYKIKIKAAQDGIAIIKKTCPN